MPRSHRSKKQPFGYRRVRVNCSELTGRRAKFRSAAARDHLRPRSSPSPRLSCAAENARYSTRWSVRRSADASRELIKMSAVMGRAVIRQHSPVPFSNSCRHVCVKRRCVDRDPRTSPCGASQYSLASHSHRFLNAADRSRVGFGRRANSGGHLIALVARPPKPILTCG